MTRQIQKSDLHDPGFVDKVVPWFILLEKYFRYEIHGLHHIPRGKKCIVVFNHGLIPFHGFLFAKKLAERGIYPRSLGANWLFRVPGIRDFFSKGGTLPASPKNGKILLKQNACLCVAPGGIYEALVSRPGMKRIPWERRKGFVKLAVETNTPIIPTNCPAVNSTYFNSRFLLWWRLKFLELTRLPVPLFSGIGLFPFPVKLIHRVGKPIRVTRRKGENRAMQINRIHAEVLKAMENLTT